MKNQLIPVSPSATSPGHYEPSLVPHGYRAESIGQAMSYRDGQIQFRRDLDGMVHHQNGNPIVELPYPEQIAVVQNPSPEIMEQWFQR